jgi:hypothetical protein
MKLLRLNRSSLSTDTLLQDMNLVADLVRRLKGKE